MLCQHCKKHQATTHVKTMINGEYAEYMLCPECAHELGYDNMFTDFSADFGGLLSSFFSNALPAISGATHCDTCGSTLNDIKRSGKVGCADCYDTFFSELLPIIRSIHGKVTEPNPHSDKLHQAMGFELIGCMKKVGFKMGMWRDVNHYQKQVGDFSVAPEPITWMRDLDPELIQRVLNS